ncbi:MAG: VCBS repeat-containing protein, partial [Planctomycetales bacterium]|nr:VCBS repeat-containing protein [Planctomycetales bacterium]
MQRIRIRDRQRLALPEILEARVNLAATFAILPHDVSFAGRGGLAETRSAIVVDFDQDGDLDILASSRRTKQIVWVENLDGRGSFSDEQVLAETLEPVTRIQTIDLDADGDLDIVYQSFFGTSLTWLQQQSGRLLESRTLISSDSAISDFQLGDLDGDHDIDIVTAESDADRIAWFAQQNGPEDFSDRKNISTSADSVRSLALADIDGDGDLDVLSASALDDSVQWFENADGQGQFAEAKLINVPQRANSRVSFVTTADLDGDGDADVMTTSYLLGRVVWYENLGNREFHSGRMLMDGISRLNFDVAAI